MGGGCILSISPCHPLHAVAYPIDCPNIVCLIPFPTWNPQAELSKPSREDFKISKRKRTRSLSEYIPIYQSSLQCHFFIPNHLVTRPATKRRASPSGKTFSPLKKCLGHIICITIVFVVTCYVILTCYQRKIWASLRKLFVPLVSKLVTGLLVTIALWLLSIMPLMSVFSQSNFSGLNQILTGEINVKSFILELYTHNDTKIYLRLNRNQNEQRWIGKLYHVSPGITRKECPAKLGVM